MLLTRPLRQVWDVNGARTSVLIWRSPSTIVPPVKRPLLLMIPGNPGLIEYYEDFLQYLYSFSTGELDIVAVQHANHSAGHFYPYDIPTDTKIGDGDDQKHGEDLWSLQDQIKHKLAILDYLVDSPDWPVSQIVLAGHSVGAYIACELLKQRPNNSAIAKVIHLFPTLWHIRSTPNGQSSLQYLSIRLVDSLRVGWRQV